MPDQRNTEFENKLVSVDGRNIDGLVSTQNIAKTLPEMSVEELSSYLSARTSQAFKGVKDSPFLPTQTSPLNLGDFDRYDKQLIGWDNEDLYGSMQSNWDKAANGVLKGLTLAGTTFLQGTVGILAGLGSLISTKQANSFYNNDFSNWMDRINKEAENVLPNYYTAQETNAAWYSPDNLFTTNFIFDKLIKNVGFSIGALYSGGVVSKAISSAMKGVGILSEAKQAKKVIDTLDELLPATPAAARLSKYNEVLTSSLPKFSATKIDRGITSLFGAATEGGIEALQGLNEFREAKIAEFQEKNFRMPNEAEMKQINNEASSLGNARFFMNIGLLSATNYIMLPRILGSRYSTSKAIANAEGGATDGIRRTATGGFERALPTTKLGGAITKGYKATGLVFSGAEAFEEGAQFVFGEGTTDYYNKKYGGDGASFLESLYEGVSQVGSKEGMESILLGGLSGGLQQIRSNLKQRGITGTGGRQGAATDKFVGELNATNSFQWLNDMKDAASRGVNIMQEMEAHIRQGDVLSTKDSEMDLMHNYLAVRIKNGRYDLVKEDIAAFRQQASTQEGLNKLIQDGYTNEQDTIETFNKRLTNFERHAENLKPTFEALYLKYGGMYQTLPDGTRKKMYDEKVIDQMAYAVSKIADYDQRIPELSTTLISKGIDIQAAIDRTAKNEASEDSTDPYKQIEELQVTVDEKDTLKTALKDVLQMTKRRTAFLEEYNKIAANPTEYQETSEVPTAPTQTPTVKITTKDGEEDIEVGVEYYLGRVTKFDKLGNEVYRFPTLTVLGENEDGTIKIKTSTGEVRDVSKAVLADYKLGKVSDVSKNENASFYLRNINKIAYWNLGKKKGGKIPGRLEFNSKTGKLEFLYNDPVNKKRKSIEIGIDQFDPKPGFTEGLFTFGQELTAEDKEDIKKRKESGKTKEDQAKRRTSRLKIIESLVDDTGKRLDDIQKMLQQKYTQLEGVVADLSKLENKIKAGELTKKANFKATTNRAIKAANKLSRLQEDLRLEIQKLEGEKEELEFNLEYFVDMASNIDELPTDSNDFLEELNDQVLDLGILIEETGKSINSVSSLVEKVQGALDTALSLARDAISQFEKKFPKAPLSLDNQEFVDFLKANPNFLKNKPTYKEDLKQLEEFISQIDDLDIIPNERTLAELRSQMEGIISELQDLEKQYKAKEAIVNKYSEIAEQAKKQKAEEAALLANKALMDKFFYASKKSRAEAGTATSSPEEQEEANDNSVKERQEVRPPISIAFNKTTVPAVLERESDKRHQRFLAKFPLLANTNKIVVQFVTKNNEAAFGLTGLIDKHDPTGKFTDELILAIYSEKDGNEIFFVDENGKRIGKQGEPTSLDNLVYAAMPSSSLEDSYGLRYSTTNTTPEQAAVWQAAWVANRAELLSYTNQSPIMDKINVSRGIPVFSDEIQYISGTLITEKQLNDGKPLIAISTKGTIEHQGKTVNIPKGRVMIQNGSTLEYANNRNFNQQEARTIFNVLKEFVRKANDKKDGTFDVNLMAYLHGVLLFESPYEKVDDEIVKHTVARNQFYFHKGALYFGEKEYAVPFSVASMEAHEAEIMGFLKGAYNNVNNTLVGQNKPFVEYNEDLSVKKEWPTYQHYLLSSEGRTKEEVPLSTKIRPIDPAIPNDRNFNNKYAYFDLIKVEEEKPPVVDTEIEEPKTEPLSEMEEIAAIIAENQRKLAEQGGGKSSFNVADYQKDGDTAPTTGGVEFSVADILDDTATEPTEVAKPKETGMSMAEWRAQQTSNPQAPPSESAFRLAGAYNYTLANVEEEKAYIEANSPFSVQTIKNLIAAGNGIFAWGAYQNALITLSERMEEGTGYHELFEGIYDVFLNAAEKKRIYKEFSSRKGIFVDRETGKTINYKDATTLQAKEEMAEEFRSYKLYGSLPSHIPAESWLGKFFRDLLNWIQAKLLGETNSLDNLFSRMDSAFYKNVPFKNVPTTKLNTRVIGSFNALDTDSVIKGVVSSVFQQIYKNGDTKLINELDFGKQIPLEIYDRIKADLEYYYITGPDAQGVPQDFTAYKDLIEEGIAPADIDNMLLPIVNNIFSNWGQIVASSGELLKTFKILQEQENIKEDEEAEHGGRDEGYLADAFQWDGKKNAPASIKLLIATLQESVFVAVGAPTIGEQPLRPIKAIRDSSTRMQKMVEYGKTFNALLDQLSSENTLLEKEKKIRQLADSVPEYVRIFTRLRIEKGEMSVQDWALRIKFYNTFAKQKPIALNTYINEDGTTSVGAADLDNAVKQLSNDWLAGLKSLPNISYKDDRYLMNVEAKNKQGIFIIPHDTTGPSQRMRYLSALGINFTAEQIDNLTKEEAAQIADAVSSLRTKIVGPELDVTSLYKLQIKGPLDKIFKIFLKTQNLVPASVFSDLQGNYRQTFVQTNAASRIVNDINAASTRDALFQALPHLQQGFSSDSDYINNVLFNQEGEALSPQLLIKYIQGLVTRDGEKNIPTEKLSKAKKLMQAINQNLNENYYLLIPADSQTEWMIGLKNKFLGLTDAALDQFYSYYQTEQQLGGSSKRLYSFLKDGLTESEFKKNFSDFLFKEVEAQFKELLDFNVIQHTTSGKYEWTGLDKKYADDKKFNHKALSLEQVEQILTERTVNFVYNNIEIHKMFFGDPAAYTKGTRRYKSFLSPREQALYDTPAFDAQANKEYNTIAGVPLKKGDPGYILYRNAMKTISTSDVFSFNELPGYEGTTKENTINGSDGQGVATLVAYKQMRIKNGFRWSEKDEANAQYAFAEDRFLMSEDGLYKYTDKALREHDEALTSKPLKDLSRFSPLKPIVSGFNNGGPLLDKYSIAAITYKAVRGTNWALQYKRMLDNQVGYIIYESGRKVGVKGMDSIYNTDKYLDSAIEEVPFKWFGIQVETGGDEKSQTWGSQTGKLNTVNLMNAGLPIDYEGEYDQWYALTEEEKLKASPIYTLIVKEKSIRTAMIENGYQQLLEKVGINKDGTVSKKKLLSVIKDELTRRELNDNIKEVLQMEGDDFLIPLEALNNYEQIKNIIFSYVKKYISSPKVSGGAKIQVSGSGWEVAGQRIVKRKNKDGQTIYTAAGLKFYTKEKPWMEVMLPNWFASKIRQIPSLRELTNEELIHYINTSPDMKEILSGIGFRIPTQELNSIENFRVKAFLPEEFGDMIVVPEALTKKSGGDFDVDKLNTYLKNVYINSVGELAVVPYYGQGEEAIQQFRDLIASGNLVEKLLSIGKSKFQADSKTAEEVLEEMTYGPEEALEDAKDAEDLAQRMYKQSIENEYFRTLDQIFSLEQNFDRLVAPNNSDELMELRDILEGISEAEFGQGVIKSILSPTYMNNLRHMYISGKSNVGIAASAQTQNAVSQKTPIIIDPSKKVLLKEGNERDFIGDAVVKLPSNSIKIKGKTFQTISKSKDRVGRYISDKISQFINGFVDIAADPFLAQMGVTRDNAGTFMFLERMGVPTDTTVYFMNQPIIREYNKMLEKSGSTYPYISDNVEVMLQQFPTKNKIPAEFPTKGLEALLKSNIERFYNASLTQEENAFQHLVLSEYLKYSVMASNLFRLSQATNYDTAKFSDPWLYYRKQLKTQDAATNNIFSSAQDSLNNTFVGPIADRIGSAVKLISNSFFKFLHEGINPYIFPVMEALANRKKMNDLDFQKAARKVEQSFINFLSQTSTGLNDRIKDLLIDEETSAARLLEQMKAKLEGIKGNPFKVLSSFITEDKASPTSTKTIKIFNKGTTAFEQNTFIAAMKELEANPTMKELYGKLARIAFLQSGVAKSPISFTELLPVETFKAFILPAIKELSNPTLMKAFIETGTFYKNNWKDINIVPKLSVKFDYVFNEEGGEDEIVKSEFTSESLNAYAKAKGNTNFRAFKVYAKANVFSSEYATLTLGKGKDRKTWLLKKLIDPSTNSPFTFNTGEKFEHTLFYAVNPLGDGYKGQEHYSNVRQSVFSNEGVKQEVELTPEEVIRAIRGELQAPTTKQSAPTEEDFLEPKKEERQTLLQLPGTESSTASPKTLALVNKFLERIGVNRKELPQYDLGGKKIDANGQANLLNDVLKVAEGKEDVALTEEAMHFAVAIIKQTNPALFKQMMNKIGSFNYYKTIFNEYSKRYLNKEGRPDIAKIKEEAIGKILAEYLINDVEGATEKPELLAQTISWWQQIKDFFLALIGKATFNPFETAVKELDNIQDTKALDAPYKELADRIIEKAPPGIQGAAANGAHKRGNYRAVVSMFSEQLEDERTYQTIIDDYLQGDGQLAQEILRAGEAFLQTAPARETIFDKINKKIQDFQLVKRTDKNDPDDENNNSFYEITVNGKTEKVDRTTEWAKKRNIQKNGGKDYLASATPTQKKQWAQKAMSGTNGHMALEGIIKHNLLPDGTLKPKAEWRTPDTTLVAHPIYVEMSRFLLGYREPVTGEIRQGFLDQFPVGAKFGVEKMLYNEKTKRASTLDLIVELPDGSLKVYDWKFMGFLLQKPDQAFLKRSQHALQLGDYKTSLREAYGVKKVDAYTVPIHAEYIEQGGDVKLKSVTFGEVNFKNEKRTSLLPVVPVGQSSGNKEIDQLVASLEAHYKKIYSRKEDPKTKYEKIEQLQQLSNAIRNLQVALNFDPLAAEALNFRKNTERALAKYEELNFTGVDEEALAKQLDELLEIFHSSETYSKLDEVFSSEYKEEELNEASRKTLSALRIASSRAKETREQVLGILEKYVSYIARKEGVDNILSPTKEVTGALNTMIERGSILLPMANLAVQRALDKRSRDKQIVAKEVEKFGELYLSLNKLASSKGKKAFQLIGKDNQLIKKVKKEFWDQFNEALEKQDKQFILSSIDQEAFNKELEEEVNRRLALINDTIYTTNVEDNIKMQKHYEDVLMKGLNIYAKDFNGWNDRGFTSMVKRHIIEKPHWTEEYKALHNTGNEAALAMHSYLFSLNKKAFSLGYLEHGNSMAFFPMVTGTILERLAQASSASGTISDILADVYKVDAAQEQAFGAINPETGALEKSIPRLFTRTNREGEALSKDLLKVIPLYIRALQEYSSSKDLEMEMLTYELVERAKKHLEVEGGQVIFDAEGPKEFQGNENNANILRDMNDWLVYGIRESSNTLFDVAASKVTKGTEEEKKAKTVSAKKALTQGNMLTQSLAVGLKALVAIPNYIGAHMQSIINAGLYYSPWEYEKNHTRIVGSMLFGVGANIDKGLIDLIVPLNDDIVKEGQRKIARKQSPLKWLSTWTFREFMMSTNQYPDMAHQLTNAKSFNDNAMVVNGEIVNIKQHLFSLPEYQQRYKDPSTIKQKERELNDKVKELRETKSLPKIATFNAEGFLEIPGVSEEALAKYRTSVSEYARKITGQMSQENAAKYRSDILVKSFMMFKNWIPKQVALRTLDIKHNPSLDQWEYGRTRLFIKTWSHLGFRNIHRMRDIITASPKGIEIMKEMVDQKREEYYRKTGLELTITDEEFYDMVRKELSAQMKELAILFSIAGMVVAAKLAAPPEDEDRLTQNRYKFWAKAINKASDEIWFYYNPTSAESITRGYIFPALNLLSKSEKFIKSARKDLFGYIQDDEEAQQKAHTLKYFFNMVPVAAQFQNELLPIIDAEAAKEWGIISSAAARAMR